MATLAEATKPVDTSKMTLITSSAQNAQSPQLNASADPEFSPLAIAPIPPILGTETDAARQFYRRGVSQNRMPPLPSQAKIAIGATAQSQVINQQFIGGGGPELMVNNVENPVQSILNLTGPGVSYGPAKGQVQIGGGSLVGPGYVTTGILNGTISINSVLSGGSNVVGGGFFLLPTEIITGHLFLNIESTDTPLYDVGLYGPFTGVETTLPLVVNLGPTVFSSTGSQSFAWTQGPTTVAAGYYFMFFTTATSGGLLLTVLGVQTDTFGYLYLAQTSTLSSGSTLPTEIVPPAQTPAITSGGAGFNKPPNFAFALAT